MATGVCRGGTILLPWQQESSKGKFKWRR